MTASNSSASISQTATQIAALTAENDHNGACVLLAVLLGDETMIKAMKRIADIRDAFGYMPPELITLRSIILKLLLDQAKMRLRSDEYHTLHMAF